MSTSLDKYTEGYDLSNVTHLPAVSRYSDNYYVNGADLLYADNDDDNTTEWYLMLGKESEYLGYTHASENDSHLHKGANI